MKYRAEIDGLRALAVLPVVFFHADFKSFSGGFVGVDVFFVISGYLISSIILKELSEKQFCLVHFYERRARRILPALFLVVLVSLLFAWQWLPPRDLKDFGQSMVAVSTFLSNVLFWWESDYFATTSELKPLLHTWSLAVEEQFYILYPLALMFLWRFGLKTIVKLLIIIFFLSICTSYWGTLREPSFTFYMLPTRAWELIVGAFVAIFLWQKGFIISNITNQLLSLTGLFLIFYSVVMFDKNTSFPGLHALIPTLGTVLVILSSVKGTFTHALLSFKPLVGVGLISYSTYLWHQPILALARHRAFGTLSFLELIVLCVLSIVLGYLSWKFVEKPFRIKNKIGNKSLFVFSFFGLFLFSLIGFYIHSTNGVMYKFPEKVIELEKVKYHSINSTKNCKVKLIHGTVDEILKSCQIGNTNKPPVFAVIGDSHARALIPAFDEISKLNEHGLSGLNLTMASCFPSLGQGTYLPKDSEQMNCIKYRNNLKNMIKMEALPRFIFVSARWAMTFEGERFNNREGGVETGKLPTYTNEYMESLSYKASISKELEEMFAEFASLNLNVTIIYQVPELGWDPTRIITKKIMFDQTNQLEGDIASVSFEAFEHRNAPTFRILDEIAMKYEMYPFYPHKLLCNASLKGRCMAINNEEVLYDDDDHVSLSGGKLIVEQLFKENDFISTN